MQYSYPQTLKNAKVSGILYGGDYEKTFCARHRCPWRMKGQERSVLEVVYAR